MTAEGVFLIAASTKNVFLNRKNKLEEITGFSTGGFNSYEENEGVWKVITMADFEGVEELKKVINTMKKYTWYLEIDSYLLNDGKEIFSEGKWLI